MAAESQERERNRETVRRLIDEAYDEKRLDVVDELLVDDFVEHEGEVHAPAAHGPAEFKENIARLQEMASDHAVSSDLQLAHEEYGTVCWTATGTNDGPFMGRVQPGNPSSIR